jgi:hypothetical protein
VTPGLADWIETGGRKSRSDANHALAGQLSVALDAGWVVDDGALKDIPCSACDEGHYAPVQIRESGARAYCANDGWFVPDADEVGAVRLAFDELAACLRDALDMPAHAHPWRAENTFVELGLGDFRGGQRTLFLARGIGGRRALDNAIHTIDEKGSQYTGLILTSSSVPFSIRTKRGHRFVPIQDVVRFGPGGFEIDMQAAEDWSMRMPLKALVKGDMAKSWTEAAEEAWQHLHTQRKLTSNASQMGRDVRKLMLDWDQGLDVPEDPNTIADHLRSLHRTHYLPRRKTG